MPGDDRNSALVDATAGAAGSLITCVLLYPLDIAKTQVQAGCSKESVPGVCARICRDEGPAGLYKGLGLKALHPVLQNFSYFYLYESLKAAAAALGSKPSTARSTAMGVLAGVGNLTGTMPLDTLIVRMQTSSDVGVRAAIAELIDGGLERAYRGFKVSCVLTLNPALTNAIFDSLKARALSIRSAAAGKRVRSLSLLQAFLIGSLAKVISVSCMHACACMQAGHVTSPL